VSPRDSGKTYRRKKERYFDYSLLFIIIFLVCFGLVMLYSTSSYNGQDKFGDSAYFLKKQLRGTVLGLIAMFIISKINYHFWERFTLLAFVLAHILSAAVLLFGTDVNGSKRWLKLGPLSFQPSEFAKLAVILFLALVISKVSKKIKNFKTMVLVMALCGPIVALVGINNLSSAIIILGIAVILIFVASPKYLQFILIGLGGIGFMGIFIYIEQYRAERLKIWLHPEDFDKGYQTLQALYAIGSGRIFGKGLGESMQKLGFVPEAQNDMIFSIICEELGLFGAVSLILLFLLMIWRFMVIANNAQDLYGSLIVVGIMAHIAIQVILNIAVVTNSIPNTGITLPFISYGGTSALFLLSEMGLALSVARQIKLEN
jgi:cell division protein FtsW